MALNYEFDCPGCKSKLHPHSDNYCFVIHVEPACEWYKSLLVKQGILAVSAIVSKPK